MVIYVVKMKIKIMTLKELILKLQQYPEDTEVLQRDTYFFNYHAPNPRYDSYQKILYL